MNVNDLNKFATWENKRLKKFYDQYKLNAREKIFIRITKINEEVGELNDQILGKFNLQRSCKKQKYNQKQLGKELSDVILTTLLLSDELGINIEKELEDKIKVIKNRDY